MLNRRETGSDALHEFHNSSPSFARRLAVGFLRMLQYCIYFPLLWLRPLVVGLAGFISPICLLAGLGYWFFVGWKWAPTGLLLLTSLVVMILAYVYDTILLFVSPDDIDLIV